MTTAKKVEDTRNKGLIDDAELVDSLEATFIPTTFIAVLAAIETITDMDATLVDWTLKVAPSVAASASKKLEATVKNEPGGIMGPTHKTDRELSDKGWDDLMKLLGRRK